MLSMRKQSRWCFALPRWLMPAPFSATILSSAFANASLAGINGGLIGTAAIQSRSTNARLWQVRKSRGLMLPQTSFKTQVVLERFCLSCGSRY